MIITNNLSNSLICQSCSSPVWSNKSFKRLFQTPWCDWSAHHIGIALQSSSSQEEPPDSSNHQCQWSTQNKCAKKCRLPLRGRLSHWTWFAGGGTGRMRANTTAYNQTTRQATTKCEIETKTGTFSSKRQEKAEEEKPRRPCVGKAPVNRLEAATRFG